MTACVLEVWGGGHIYNCSIWKAIVNLIMTFQLLRAFLCWMLNFLRVKILIFLLKKIGK